MSEKTNNLRPLRQPKRGKEIDLLKLAAALWHNALLVVLCALLGGVLSLAYAFFMITPTYRATTTLYVNTKNISLGTTSISYADLNTATRMVDIYATILKSRETLQEVAEEAGVPYNYGKLAGQIRASAGDADGILIVNVVSANPTETELLANTVASVLPRRIADIVEGTSVKVIEYAVVPTGRSSPSYANNTMKGILMGGMLAAALIVGVALLRDMQDNNIHGADELRELYPDLPVLGTVIDMRGTGSGKGYYAAYYGEKTENAKKNVG